MKHINIKNLSRQTGLPSSMMHFDWRRKKSTLAQRLSFFSHNANDNADHLSYKDSKRRYADYCDEVYTKVMGLALKMSIEGRARVKRVRQLKTSFR